MSSSVLSGGPSTSLTRYSTLSARYSVWVRVRDAAVHFVHYSLRPSTSSTRYSVLTTFYSVWLRALVSDAAVQSVHNNSLTPSTSSTRYSSATCTQHSGMTNGCVSQPRAHALIWRFPATVHAICLTLSSFLSSPCLRVCVCVIV